MTHLAVEKHVSASTQNQALSALLFLYQEVLSISDFKVDLLTHARRPERLPVVLTRPEVRQILDAMTGTPRLIAALLYSSGPRLLECLTMRVKDLDLVRNEVVVRDGKGQKDRVTMLPESVKGALARHLERVRGCMKVTCNKASAASCYRTRLLGSIRTRIANGGGSTCSPHHACTLIHMRE